MQQVTKHIFCETIISKGKATSSSISTSLTFIFSGKAALVVLTSHNCSSLYNRYFWNTKFSLFQYTRLGGVFFVFIKCTAIWIFSLLTKTLFDVSKRKRIAVLCMFYFQNYLQPIQYIGTLIFGYPQLSFLRSQGVNMKFLEHAEPPSLPRRIVCHYYSTTRFGYLQLPWKSCLDGMQVKLGSQRPI